MDCIEDAMPKEQQLCGQKLGHNLLHQGLQITKHQQKTTPATTFLSINFQRHR